MASVTAVQSALIILFIAEREALLTVDSATLNFLTPGKKSGEMNS